MRNLLYTLFMLLLSNGLMAQKQLVNIAVGEQVPDVVIKGITDATYSSASLHQMSQDQLLILDFWATWCAPCLYALPKMDSIQQEFKDQLKVVLVTYQGEKEVRNFFKGRIKNGSPVPKLPKVFGDTLLRNLFPHNTIPHYVWIKNGSVIAITESVDRDQVKKALVGQKVTTQTKIDMIKADYDRDNTPLIQFLNNPQQREQKGKVVNYSIFTKFIPELGDSGGTSLEWDSLGNIKRITNTNINLVKLYKMAYGKMRTYINDGAVDILSNDTLVRRFDVSGMAAMPIIEKRTFCYEIVSADDHIFEKMQQDLKIAVPEFTAKVIVARDSCLVLEKINNDLESYVVDSKSRLSEFKVNGNCVSNKNCDMSSFRTTLEAVIFRYAKWPIVDQTGFLKRFDIEFCYETNSMEDINVALLPYGLQLSLKIAEHERLVIEKS